jgi:L-amino acid N-acyltransferase YncA
LSNKELLDGLVLRDCNEEDMAAITAIYRHAVQTGFGTFEIDPPDETEMKIRRRVMLGSKYPYLVAEIEGKVVGFAYANSYRSRPAYQKTVENSIYIRDGMQGQGIGEKLLAALIARVSAGGFRQMVAVIGDSANIGSIRLHEKLGFAHIGTLHSVGWKHGRWLDTILMQLPLGPGDTEAG